VEEAHASLSSVPAAGAMVVADLGCSSGPNTLSVVSMVLDALAGRCEKKAVQVQFFLNDLPGNDFNLVFRSLERFREAVGKEKGEAALPPYYIAGLPGSFYTRLFPDHCVHLFHSSYCLMIRSKVPEALASGAIRNEGNVYIWDATPPSVVEAYQELFREDFSLFLQHRHTELVAGGRIVLTFLGRKNKDVLHGEMSYVWGFLSKALRSLVQQVRHTRTPTLQVN
jgi:jasmonate O-methyltransferase